MASDRSELFPYVAPEAPKIYYHIFGHNYEYLHSIQVSVGGNRKPVHLTKMQSARIWNPKNPFGPPSSSRRTSSKESSQNFKYFSFFFFLRNPEGDGTQDIRGRRDPRQWMRTCPKSHKRPVPNAIQMAPRGNAPVNRSGESGK